MGAESGTAGRFAQAGTAGASWPRLRHRVSQDSTGGRRFTCRHSVEERAVEQSWREAERAWSHELGSPGFVRYLRRNAESLPSLLTGEQDRVALLFPEGRFEAADSLYRENTMARYLNRAVSAAVHRIAMGGPRGRRLRVLEVGAGTGATTDGAVDVLSGFDVDYLFTDASPFFLPAARIRFDAYRWVRLGLFDVDESYRAQGLVPNSFDVVLAAGVLEYARDIERSLAALTELLAGGWCSPSRPVSTRGSWPRRRS